MNRIILSIFSLVFFCVTSIQAQTSSISHLTQLVTVNGSDFVADNITVGEDKLILNNADGTKEIPLLHGGTTQFNIQKALYCVAGTTTVDEIANASENEVLNLMGTINQSDFYAILAYTSKLKALNFYNIKLAEILNFANTLRNSALSSVTFRDCKLENVSCLTAMFRNCTNLTSVSFENCNFGNNGIYCIWMFRQCSNLKRISFANTNLNIDDLDQIFYDCSSLETIDLSGVNITKTTNTSIFGGCTNLKEVITKGCNESTKEILREKLKKEGFSEGILIE